MANYIDGFTFPILRKDLDVYKSVAETIAGIFKEYGAISYNEFVGDDMHMEGTLSFLGPVDVKEEEVVIFGWTEFSSREARDETNKRVAADPRIENIMAPLLDPEDLIFDANRMLYGGFMSFMKI